MNKKIENAVALLYNKEIHHAPVVANSLMHLDIGEEIPYSLYEAVSIILKHIYKLKAE